MMHFLSHYPFVRRREAVQWVVILLVGLLSLSNQLFAQLPSGFSKSIIQENYTNPVGMVFSTDGNQFFVWEKSGKVYVSNWNGSSYVRQSTPVLDISEEVGEWNDFGLHSFCLDPNYQTNGLIYLFYVVDLHHLLYYGTPQYSSSANMYRHATISRVTRYHLQTSGGNLTTDYYSRKVLFGESISTGSPITYESHAGGSLLFGRDGTLLLSTGDGGHHDGVDVGSRSETFFQESLNYGMMRPNENVGAMRAQMVNSFAGKVLRMDPATGDGIPSNPFYNGASPRSPQSRMWTMGLRNPYRMSLQPGTGSTSANDANPGKLLIDDVGWFRFEDFHVVDKGGLNCGWPLYEGLDPTIAYYGTNVRNKDEPGEPTFESLCLQPTTYIDNSNAKLRRFTHSRPALEYNHSSPAATRVPAFSGTTPIARTIGTTGAPSGNSFFGLCIIGGIYYTGNQFPAMYKNTYFLTDHSQGWLKNLELHNEGDHVVDEVRDFAPTNFDYGILDMKQNPRDGSIYYVRIQGTISRISYGGNQPPVANATSNVTYGTSPLTVQFTGSNSVDPEGQALSYLWNFGDGTTSNQANPTHVFTDPSVRKFTVTLVVTDNQGQASTPKEIVISVNNTPPTAQITNPAPGTLYSMSQATNYTLQANVTDTDMSNMAYEWTVILQHNNHTHPDPVLTSPNPVISISPVGCSPNESYSYRITLKVTDKGGLTATSSVVLYPDCGSASSLVSNVTATRQLNAVQVNWINPNIMFDEILVAAKTDIGFTDKPNGASSYTADANFNGNGSPFEGGKVVYKGKGTNVTVTSLNPLFQYYFRVYTRVGNTWNGGVEVSAIPNLAPVAPAITLPFAIQGQGYNFTIPAFTDPEGQSITYSATNLPGWLSFDTQARRLSGTPTQTASYTINVTATDGGNLGTTVPLVLMTGPNLPPVAPTLITQTAQVNKPLSYTFPAFTDQPGQNLTYSANGLPGWLSFNSSTRVFTGTPPQTGNYSASITATDPYNSSASITLNITVINVPPDLTPVMYARSSGLNGEKPITIVVDIFELKGVSTSGSITVKVNKDPKYNLSFSNTATSIGGRSVQNNVWSFQGVSDEDYYVLSTNQSIAGSGTLSFGLTGILTPGSTSGSLTPTAVIMGGSGGEVIINNNSDGDKIEYFQQ
ncbi:putative Ig domain-containing protein [Spirosoma sp. KNUC1025]|uniref:putative Ig domain-containing protein n=1 Tax=Spirosoma sp. KNUC1025 TaxID=2894082 RepID=UPI0038692078|nr:putative Ig domain-containing protein [Spirosoma sp. KNUC1025]